MKKVISFVLALILVVGCFSSFKLAVAAAADSSVSFDNIVELPTNSGTDLIAGLSPMVCEYKKDANSNMSYDYTFDKYALTDGDLNLDWHTASAAFAKEAEDGSIIRYQDGTAYYRMTFRLKKVSDISGICIINHQNKSLRTGKYEVYASDSLGDLYASENLIALVENTGGYRRNLITVNSGATSVVYFGVKIIDPVNTDYGEVLLVNYYPRICEIAVYGTEGDTAVTTDLENLSDKTELYATYPYLTAVDPADNKLSGKLSKVIYNNSGSFKEADSTNSSPKSGANNELESVSGYSHLTDNDPATSWYTSGLQFRDSSGKLHKDEDNFYVDIFFDAGQTIDIGMIYLANHSNKPLRFGHYQIWVSNSSSDYTKWKYVNGILGFRKHDLGSAQLIADVQNRAGAEEQFLFAKEEIKAQYFLIRVYNSCYDPTSIGESVGIYPRFNEFSVYSKEGLSGNLSLSDYSINNGVIGPLQEGETVAAFMNAQNGRGEISVFDHKGDKKGASALIGNGDTVVSHTGYIGDYATVIVEKDVNSDGRVTLTDAVRLKKSVLNDETISDYTLKAADTNSDNSATLLDIVSIANYALNSEYQPKAADLPKFGGAYGAHTDDIRRISIDTNNVINDDFIGVGTNIFPAILSSEGKTKTGYNDVYWALEQARLNALDLKMARSWFQIDWMIKDTGSKETDKQSYLNGEYDLESDWMKAFYGYASGLKNMDCDLLVNFGWKTNNRIAEWFASPNQKDSEMDIAAPGDLSAYAKATAAFVDYAKNEKGLSNIKYISFYNEPNGGHDFQVGTDVADERVYWAKMLTLIDSELKAQGLRDQIEIWGPEISGIENQTSQEWWKYTIENSEYSTAGVVDGWDFHYYCNSDPNFDNYRTLIDVVKECKGYLYNRNDVKSQKCIITEMYPGVSNAKYNSWNSWTDSFAGYFIGVANGGFSGVCSWTASTGYIPAPVNMQMTQNNNNPWAPIISNATAETVYPLFYEQSLYANYVPSGSKTLNTTWLGDDVRATAFELPGGGYTIIVEKNGQNNSATLNTGKENPFDISINLGINKNLSFNRFSFKNDSQITSAGAIVNRSDKQLQMENGILTDAYDGGYGVYVYTTLPPIKQVCVNDVTLTVNLQSSVQVSASLIDCDSSDALNYDIVACVGSYEGTVSNSGLYTPDSRAQSGDMVAVKASLKSDPNVYNVAIINIK